MGNKRRKGKTISRLRKRRIAQNNLSKRLKEEKEASGESGPAAASASTSDDPSTSGNMSSSKVEHASDEEELVIQIKEEAGQEIPVQFLPSASGMEIPIEAPPPQFNICVAPTNVGTQKASYSISINEIQDPLQGTSSTVTNPSDLQPEGDHLRPSGFITISGDDLSKKRSYKSKKVKNATGAPVQVKRNPPRQVKTMTNAQELMNRKLTDIIHTQNKMIKMLKETLEQGDGAARTSSFGKEDRFDICGKHVASLLRELPTFDALALESKLMDIVYKERDKFETFRISLKGYSAILPSNNSV